MRIYHDLADSQPELSTDADRLSEIWTEINDLTSEAVELAEKYGEPDCECAEKFRRVSDAFDDIHDPTLLAIKRKALEILRKKKETINA